MASNREDTERRLALLLEYQGTAYGGSQLQENAPTVQGALERALSSLTSESIRVALAGRTDAGVHAQGQVASFRTGSRHDAETFARGANALLPATSQCGRQPKFPWTSTPDVTRSAAGIATRCTLARRRPALLRHFVWHLSGAAGHGFDGATAGCLAGRHDFAAFTQPSEAETGCHRARSVRTRLLP